ncbi:heme transporter [Gordonia sp. 852002-10350_SCH5691597]|uniref:heme transporter n=1 Tax=Gordonia sp. 852002-10350_SCH5691597 TaxID=1834085 RepID=UPI000AD9DE6A
MPANPPDPRQPTTGSARRCARDGACRCNRAAHASDLDALLADPQFSGHLLRGNASAIGPHLPLLDQIVSVTVAGPVILNDVGVHETPTVTGGPIRCRPGRVSLRLHPDHLGAALVSEPAAQAPPMLRLFDTDGNTAHATYLTETSDRLAFEAIGLSADTFSSDNSPDVDIANDAPEVAVCSDDALDDQVTQLDSILADGGVSRLATMPAREGFARIGSRQAIAALQHAALHNVELTMAAAAPGCVQLHHDQLDGAREHEGQMLLASGRARAMINFNLVTECWVTWTQGVWGPTGSIEIYDRHARCGMVITQTGAVPPAMFDAWDHLMAELAA